MITFPLQLRKRNKVIEECNRTDIKSENLFANYYSHNYAPLPALDTLKKLARQPGFVLLNITLNPHDYMEALQELHIPYYDYVHADSAIANHLKWYLITAGTNYFDATYPSWKLQKINTGNQFNELYEVSRK